MATQPDSTLSGAQPLPWGDYASWVGAQWRELLARNPEEREVQRFLEHNPALLPGLNEAAEHRGPHAGVVFTQPRLQGLGPRQYPDFMWIEGSSDRLTPVLIEIEKPGKAWFTKSGLLTAQFHRAHQQLGDWMAWFLEPENQLTFRRTYVDWMGSFTARPIVPRYVLIYGRDAEFADDHSGVRAGRRFVTARTNETLVTYDHLDPAPGGSNLVTVHLDTLGRLRVRAIPPTLVPGPQLETLARRADTPVAAIKEVPMWSEDQKSHVLSQWRHWAADPR